MNANKRRKLIRTVKAVGLSTCCAVLSSCGNGLPTSKTSSSTGGSTGTPALSLQIDKFGDGSTWEDIPAGSTYNRNCNSSQTDFNFRLVNSGTGSLTTSSTAVTATKTTNYTGGPENGVASDFSFTLVTTPTLPIAANASADFTLRLSIAGGVTDCPLGGFIGNSWGFEDARLRILTNDPTNPTYDATIHVLGGS